MQQVQTASRWTELLKWAGPLGTLLVGIGAFIGSFINRKKRDIQVAERHKTEAEAELDRADAADKYGRLGLEMIGRLRETQRELSFLHQQLRYRNEMETIARNRTHRAVGELSSANLVIREREEMLRKAEVEFVPYRVKTQEEIFGDEDLPLPPDADVTLS